MEEGVVTAGGQLARHGVLSAEPAEAPPVVEVSRGGRRCGEPRRTADSGSTRWQQRLPQQRNPATATAAAAAAAEKRGGIIAAGADEARRRRRRHGVMERIRRGGEERIAHLLFRCCRDERLLRHRTRPEEGVRRRHSTAPVEMAATASATAAHDSATHGSRGGADSDLASWRRRRRD